MRKLLPVFLFVALLIIPASVLAEGLTLTKIGALNVNGKYYNHWYYEPTRLTLEGTGSKGANIDIYIDGAVKTIKASTADGSWKYSHDTELEKKDHTVKIASGNQEISFILTIGTASVPEGSQQASNGELPQTGVFIPVLGLLLLGGFLVYYGFREKVV